MDIEPEHKKKEVSASDALPTASSARDELRGKFLIAAFALLGIAILAFAGFSGYRIVKSRSMEGVSISAIPKEVPVEESDAVAIETIEPAEEKKPTETVDPKKTGVLVLNGGAAKGSAGTLGTTLEKAGYEKVEVGNATLDYTGTTVYSSKENKSVAEEVKKDILKQYPKAEWAEADPKKPETAKSDIVIVLGK